MNNNKVIDISKKTFISVIIILEILVILTIVLTYIIPKGEFYKEIDGTVNFGQYYLLENQSGINIFKGIFAPILLLLSKDAIGIIMLCLFLIVVTASFQVMSDSDGMKIIVQKLIDKFKGHNYILIAIIVLIFMVFGSFFGLFEEVLTLLPIILVLAISLGYDSYTGFLMCVCATGFGFASAITNPFTILAASAIIKASPITNIWYRIVIFIVMFCLIYSFIMIHIKRIEKNPKKSPTYEKDLLKRENLQTYVYEDSASTKRTFKVYVSFLLIVLLSIITITSISFLRGFTVVFLIAIFLIGGLLAGYLATRNIHFVLKSFLKGALSALPAILMVLMASSIKFILEEGHILATITNSISLLIEGKPSIIVILIIFVIVLILEFFISSSTAKAVFVMGILSGVSLGLSKELVVLAYAFGDGYTNLLFPTSPVLLIALGMTGVSYTAWIKKSKWLFLITFCFVIGFLCFGVLINY